MPIQVKSYKRKGRVVRSHMRVRYTLPNLLPTSYANQKETKSKTLAAKYGYKRKHDIKSNN